jgi:hypothetical protein
MCRSLDGIYVYVLVACHVHICDKCDFLYSTIVVIMFCGIILDLAFLVGWLILFLLLNLLIFFFVFLFFLVCRLILYFWLNF